MILTTDHSNDYGVWVSKWMIKGALRSNYENIIVVTATKMKLAFYLCQASNNVLYNKVLVKATNYWSFSSKEDE
ncbi:hypothetical protein P8452_04040 [Trifolium repens]|nr:hypothetical protein P8452_04040 [Trifolium repens]